MKTLDDSILCRAAVQLAPTATGVMMYMPGGLQTITPIGGGVGAPITVAVNAAGAAALNEQHAAIVARGKRPMFDFNHEDGAASFWPAEYFWAEQPEPGIYCRGEWTASGKAGVDGKEWRQFSPVFHVSKKLGATPQSPAAIVCRANAKANMGGLVNDPAFHTILPLWAKDSSGDAAGENQNQNQNQHTDHMNGTELAALRAKNQELETELSALKAKNADATAIAAKAAELRAVKAEIAAEDSRQEVEALKAKNKTQGEAITARNRADAQAAVDRAVKRNAIPAKDDKTRDALVAKATEDPSFITAIEAMQGQQLSGRISPSGVTITHEAPNATMKEFAAIISRNAALPLSYETHKQKGKLASEAAALFARDIEKDPVLAGMSVEEAIKAADVTNAAVGLLAGTLVLQRALPLMQYEYPILGSITSDYSDSPGLYNQTETTRILLKPAVQTRGTAVDSAGRPTGWTTVSPAQSVDVSVTLDEHVGVPVVFGQNILASTVRNLFAEQVPMAIYALGGYAVNKLTALLTAANFNAYKGTSLAAGVTTDGSTAISYTSSTNVYVGQPISGTGIPSNTYIASVTSATAAVLTQPATADGTGLTFTLSASKVPNTYTTYAKALADFNMASLGDIKAAFDVNEVPMSERFALLNSSYYGKLAQDPTFNTFFAATRKPEIITDGALPKLQGFNPLNAPWFPTSSNRVGFAGHKASLILKSRLPNDLTGAVDAMIPGSVTTVSAPGGISVLLVQYVSLREGYAEWRPEVMLGAAVGDRRAGMVLTSE
jgi:hypothetical protein